MGRTTQAVILARGLGTRMRRADESATLTGAEGRAADAGLKGMIPFDRPFLDYVLSALADAGISQATIVVGPEHGAVRDYFAATAAGRRVSLAFAEQREARGTADAVLAARAAVGDATFLVLNADNYYYPSDIQALAQLGDNGLLAYEAEALVAGGGIERDRVLRFALLDIGADDTLLEIHEKPAADDPLARRAERWVSMNLWSFTPEIFGACERVAPSTRGENELQSAVALAIGERGITFRVIRARSAVLDLSTRADVERVGTQLAGVRPQP